MYLIDLICKCTFKFAGNQEKLSWINLSLNKWTVKYRYLLGSILPRVYNVESLATKQDVNRSAASFLCRELNSFSRSSWNGVFPLILRVPPEPEPYLLTASL